MLSLLAMNFHAARLGFEAQNAMAFRLLRLVSERGGDWSQAQIGTLKQAAIVNKPAPPEIPKAEVDDPPAIRARAAKVASASARRASARKVHKKTTKSAKKKIMKRSK